MPSPRAIGLFCGSRTGTNPRFLQAAEAAATAIARRGLELVYGGGRVGLMGVAADAALAAGARVVGVIPEALAREEIAHDGLSELHIVAGMHERKALMNARSDAFLVLPGGIGTFEEFFEILSWALLGLHGKPTGILNVDGYFDPLLALIQHAVDQDLANPRVLDLLLHDHDADALLHRLLSLAARTRPEPSPPRPIMP
ncbi:MAG: cytokinin riboside 5'-monophosphate phosphoribohydrolase [Isosphaeraceae bacterium]|jgi:uncharacterized protein (TIGR00730 family)|nr:MAG: cytokinin riboside 5'-monophosphate phosphoribohydrolase [Isosphaeraceae bacterium]